LDRARAQQIAEVVEDSSPAEHGLPGHGWALKELKQWAFEAFGRIAGRDSIRRVSRRAKLTWKEVKERLGEAKPEKRAAHVEELLKVFAGVCEGEVILV
jgi:transposase